MWTDTTRALHARTGLALPSDLTDAEWAVLEPLLPPASHVGRPRKWPMRRIVEAILYLLRGRLPWRMLPPCFPPVSTVRRWFYMWRDDRLWLAINHTLLMTAREAQGREASPSAGVIDSQSVKTTESGGPRGYDAGKKIKGRKRHILTDTEGNLVHAVIHTADIQDRDGAPLVLAEIVKRFPWLRHIFADGGYAGNKLKDALRRISKWTIEIIKRVRYRQRLRGLAPPLGGRAHAGMAQPEPTSRQGLRADHRLGYPAGALSDRMDRVTILLIGILLLIGADLMLAFAPGLPGIGIGVILWGLHMGFTQGLFATLVADAAPLELRGTAFGMFNLVTGIAMLAASVMAGAMWDLIGYQATFIAGALFAVLTVVGLLPVRHRLDGRIRRLKA